MASSVFIESIFFHRIDLHRLLCTFQQVTAPLLFQHHVQKQNVSQSKRLSTPSIPRIQAAHTRSTHHCPRILEVVQCEAGHLAGHVLTKLLPELLNVALIVLHKVDLHIHLAHMVVYLSLEHVCVLQWAVLLNARLNLHARNFQSINLAIIEQARNVSPTLTALSSCSTG